MKTLSRILGIVFGLVVLTGIGLYIFVSTFDANKYKPLIIEKASTALGREVDFTDVSLEMSLKQGIHAAIRGLTIGENPAYGKGDFLKVSEVFVGINPLDYLTKREVTLSGITIASPDITIIKGTEGKLSIETLGKKKEAEKPAEESGGTKLAAAPVILVKRFSIKDGKLTLIDRSQGQEMKASISRIDFGVEDFSLTDTFPVWLKAAAFAEKQNVSIKGRLQLDLAQQGVAVRDLDAEIDLGSTDLALLKTLPTLKDKPVPDSLKGKLSAHIGQFSVGKAGLGPIAADISLKDGAVKFAQVSPGVALDIPSLDFTLKNFAPGKEGDFDLKMAYLSDAPNITASGKVSFDQKTQKFSISGGKVDTELSTLSLDKLKASVASMKEANLPQSLKGKLGISGLKVQAGGGTPATYSGDLALENGLAKLAKLPSPLENIAANIGFTQETIDIANLALNVGSGSLNAKGKVADYKAAKRFNLTLATKEIPLDALLDQSENREKAEGLLTANLALSGAASQLDSTLNGKGDLAMTEARLVNVNVLARVLDKITIIPNLRPALERNLPRVWQQKLEKSDTEITKFTAATTITNGVAAISPIDIEAEGFIFEGKGTYTLAGKRYVLDGTFIMPQDMAADMVAAVKEMAYLQNAQKEIRFPLKVEGTVGGKASFTPVVSAVVKDALQNKGKEQLMRVLDKKWNKDGKNDATMDMLKGFMGVKPEQPPQQGQQPPASQQQGTPPASQQPAPQPEPAPAPQPTPEQQMFEGLIKGFSQ